MFFFSMIQDGPRGLEGIAEPVDEEVEDVASYGIDWVDAEDPALMQHLLNNNPHDWDEDNPFAPGPTQLSHVPCDPPDCPFSQDEIQQLDEELGRRVNTASRSMEIRRLVWIEAFSLCAHLYQARQNVVL